LKYWSPIEFPAAPPEIVIAAPPEVKESFIVVAAVPASTKYVVPSVSPVIVAAPLSENVTGVLAAKPCALRKTSSFVATAAEVFFTFMRRR
jgi:hypothetical protein